MIKKNHALFISSIQHLIWYYCFELLNRRCCGVAVIKSAKHAEGLQFKSGDHQGKFFTKRCFYLIKIKIKHFISSLSNIWYEITARRTNLKVLWCSGYHVCLTRRRSPVQARTASRQVFDKMMFFYLIKNKIKHFISSLSNIWYEITARSTHLKVLWCSGYHVCLTRRRFPVQAWTAARQVFDKMMFFYLIKNKIKRFISCQPNIWYEITARSTNLKVLWCSGNHVCVTRRRSPVQSWTASRQVFDKMIFFYLIKNKIKHFISSQSNIWYEFAVGSTNLNVLWCSSFHDCVTRRRSPVQAWTASRKTFHNIMSLLDLKKIMHFISRQFNIW